ncbi:hypothetical protein OKW34_002257 [Paraburkholderia youngii]|uniref:hypothetical protein n=1 Tax=Paraburkholderia youngii TaxID=2782701 RepID=UPI00159265DE|nr:hypothetical protein [Paraburkholderia youngii]NUX59051.1 hypothetical protein [Paraburkholderia youngii]
MYSIDSALVIPGVAMKRFWVWLMSIALLGGLVACGGGGGDHESPAASRPLGVAGDMEGIWNGNLHSNVTGRDKGMFAIVTAGGRFELITDDCAQISATITASGPIFSGAGTSYTQTNCDGVNVVVTPLTPGAGTVQSIQVSGHFDGKTGTAIASYSTSNDGGTIRFINFYSDYFNDPGVISRAVGSYSIKQRLTALTVDASGNVAFRDATGQIFAGTLFVLDPTVDIYGMTLQVGERSLTGLATLVDDGDGPNNDFLFVVANGVLAYNSELRRN